MDIMIPIDGQAQFIELNPYGNGESDAVYFNWNELPHINTLPIRRKHVVFRYKKYNNIVEKNWIF